MLLFFQYISQLYENKSSCKIMMIFVMSNFISVRPVFMPSGTFESAVRQEPKLNKLKDLLHLGWPCDCLSLVIQIPTDLEAVPDVLTEELLHRSYRVILPDLFSSSRNFPWPRKECKAHFLPACPRVYQCLSNFHLLFIT